MAFNFDIIADSLGKAGNDAEQELSNFTQSMDPNSTQDILLLQKHLQEWSMITNLQSSIVKTLRDVLSSVVQKM